MERYQGGRQREHTWRQSLILFWGQAGKDGVWTNTPSSLWRSGHLWKWSSAWVRTAQLLCSLTGMSREAIPVLYHVLASVVRPMWICHPRWGTAPVPQWCRGSLRAIGDQEAIAGQDTAQQAALGAEASLNRKLSVRTEPLSHDRSPLRSVLTKASPARTPLVGQLSTRDALSHSPGNPLAPSPTSYTTVSAVYSQYSKQSPFFQETLSLNEFIQDYLKPFFINKQAVFTK